MDEHKSQMRARLTQMDGASAMSSRVAVFTLGETARAQTC